MAIDFAKLNKNIDLDGLKADIKDAANNSGGDYKEVPEGTYEVKVEQAEVKLSKKGDPMASIWFRIVAGDFKNSIIFYNQVITQGFGIHNCNELLRSFDTPELEIEFIDFEQYNNLLMDFAEANEDVTAALVYGTNKKGYPTFSIEEVFVD